MILRPDNITGHHLPPEEKLRTIGRAGLSTRKTVKLLVASCGSLDRVRSKPWVLRRWRGRIPALSAGVFGVRWAMAFDTPTPSDHRLSVASPASTSDDPSLTPTRSYGMLFPRPTAQIADKDGGKLPKPMCFCGCGDEVHLPRSDPVQKTLDHP